MTEEFIPKSSAVSPAPRIPKFTRELEAKLTGAAVGLMILYASLLALGQYQHLWIIDAHGRPVVNDYVVFWTVGKMVLNGSAAAAYDAKLEHAAELATIGHPYTQVLGWSYPPLFLFVVALLARLPYLIGFLLWGTSALVFEAAIFAAILKRRSAFLWACAMPWVPEVLIVGQNGLLTAGLVGAVLLNLQKRPVLAGLVIGLLSYKPQFGVLIPLALMAGGYWRVFLWAAASTIACNLAAGTVFGFDTFAAFLHAMNGAAGSHLLRSDLGWNKLQSLYGILRYAGAPAALAWLAQLSVSFGAAVAVVLTWRNRDLPVSLKAAQLAAAIPLTTPYILYYDVPLAGIAAGFLLRHRRIERAEWAVIAPTFAWLFAPLLTSIPGAFPFIVAINFVALRRVVLALWPHRHSVWDRLLNLPPVIRERVPAELGGDPRASIE